MKNTRIPILPLLSCVLAINCLSPIGGGNGSETTNGFVQGRLMQSDGWYASDARVCLVPVNYNPVKDPPIAGSMIDTTDEDGSYSLETARPGIYNIQALSLEEHTSTLVTGVTVAANDTLHRLRDTLKTPGLLNVAVTDRSDAGYVYIAGTTLRAMVRNNAAVINGVPAGDIPAVYYCNPADSTQNHLIKAGIAVKSGRTLTIADLTSWNFSRRLYLNTTGSGADVAGTVTNFPVLVRLSGVNFDFSQADDSGADIRFTKSGTPLAFEIERWDSAGQSAEVWVKVDTVYGNNSTQHILMHWGAVTATPSLSNGAAVFDTAHGFQGVWHLNEPGDAPAYDATANRYDGAPYGMNAASATEGRVGICRKFDGDSGSFIMEGTANSKLNFPEDGNYSISVWVRSDTMDDDRFLTVASKGDRQYELVQQSYTPNQWMFSQWGQAGQEASDDPMTQVQNWTHIVGVRSGTMQSLYIDGLCVDNDLRLKEPLDSLHTRYTGFDFMIGRIASKINPDEPHFFKGKIDEVRACNIARSADWIKLSYMNQQSSDQLVEMR